MSGFTGLLASEAVASLATPVVGRLLDFIPDPEKRAEEAASAATALLAADESLLKQQNDINLEEAKSENLFVSGWRPFIGWCCGAALLWQILLAPFVAFNCAVFGYHPALPELNPDWMTAILVPLLGLGAMRSVEKIQRVAGPLMGTTKPAAVAPAPQAGLSVGMKQAALTTLLSRPAVATRPAPSVAATPAPAADTHAATRDTFARTLWGEARGEGQAGMEAVANVICRRAAFPRWWGNDIRSVCLAPSQFSCWLPGDPNRPKLQAVDATDAAFATALDIAERAIAQTLVDRTNSADSYADLSSAHPIWANVARQTAMIGRHTFFRLET
ncbi:3TM-type holin [Lichenicola sp.]|uniref:3TM-type holin n=1 Tax=Lichenicola sp. TaxID=2804529 RepID=UPI003B00D9A5